MYNVTIELVNNYQLETVKDVFAHCFEDMRWPWENLFGTLVHLDDTIA